MPLLHWYSQPQQGPTLWLLAKVLLSPSPWEHEDALKVAHP